MARMVWSSVPGILKISRRGLRFLFRRSMVAGGNLEQEQDEKVVVSRWLRRAYLIFRANFGNYLAVTMALNCIAGLIDTLRLYTPSYTKTQ